MLRMNKAKLKQCRVCGRTFVGKGSTCPDCKLNLNTRVFGTVLDGLRHPF